MELKARIFTAETDDSVGQYIIFCRVFDQQMKEHGRTEIAAKGTIRIGKDRGMLKEDLENQEKKVVSIMIMLFDQQYALEAYVRAEKKAAREEGRAEGRAQGRAEGRA